MSGLAAICSIYICRGTEEVEKEENNRLPLAVQCGLYCVFITSIKLQAS